MDFSKVDLITFCLVIIWATAYSAEFSAFNDANRNSTFQEVFPQIIRIKPAAISDIPIHLETKEQDLSTSSDNQAPIIVIKPIKVPDNPKDKTERQSRKFSAENTRTLRLPRNRRRSRKRLKFILDGVDENGVAATKVSRVHIAPGAYPIFYGLSKINGKFLEKPIKSFRADEFVR